MRTWRFILNHVKRNFTDHGFCVNISGGGDFHLQYYKACEILKACRPCRLMCQLWAYFYGGSVTRAPRLGSGFFCIASTLRIEFALFMIWWEVVCSLRALFPPEYSLWFYYSYIYICYLPFPQDEILAGRMCSRCFLIRFTVSYWAYHLNLEWITRSFQGKTSVN